MLQAIKGERNDALWPTWFARHWTAVVCAVALLFGVAARIAYGQGMPLWLDETFTGTIATQPTPAGLLRWSLSELTGPVFYGSMWLWVHAFGAATDVLRLPSLILSLAAPILLYRWGHSDQQVRQLWSSVALLWLPIMMFANDARPYPLLFLLGCLQAIVFLRLLQAPRTPVAFAWTCVTAALILTHYGALAIGGTQGLAYCLLHRRRALTTWPAALVFVPVIGWMAYHLPFVVTVTGGGSMASADGLLNAVLSIPATLFGASVIGVLVIAPIMATLVIACIRQGSARIVPSPDITLAVSGVVACLGMTIMTALHPGIVPRYMIPSAPAMLFGIALWTRWIVRFDAKPAVIVLGMMVASTGALCWSSIKDDRIDARHHFALEPASLWLMEQPPRRLIFLWTDHSAAVAPTRNLTDLASFVFQREGHPVEVHVVRPVAGQDTSRRARMAAGRDPATTILWLANDRDTPVPTLSHIGEQDPSWECREFGGGYVTANACRRRPVAGAGDITRDRNVRQPL